MTAAATPPAAPAGQTFTLSGTLMLNGIAVPFTAQATLNATVTATVSFTVDSSATVDQPTTTDAS